MPFRRRKPFIKILLLILFACLCVLLVLAALREDRNVQNVQIQNAGEALHGAVKQTGLNRGEETAELKKHTDTVLLLGIDKDGGMPVYSGRRSFYNMNQADVIVLLCIDNDAKSVTPVQINRDTMMDVPWLDVLGKYGGTEFEQICLAYNSGSGLDDSCENTVDAVRSLLFNAPIEHYLAFTMGGISTLNDLVGGVTVTVVDDMTSVDPILVQGTTVTLMGEHAENFIRARMELADDTNLSRMRRHRDYFTGFMDSARKVFNSDSEFMMKAVEKLQPYMTTDLTAEAMSSLASKLDTYEINTILHAKGELTVNPETEFYEFRVDEDDLWSIVKKALCVS